MKIYHKQKIKEYYADGFSISELAIMYRVSEYRVSLVLEKEAHEK